MFCRILNAGLKYARTTNSTPQTAHVTLGEMDHAKGQDLRGLWSAVVLSMVEFAMDTWRFSDGVRALRRDRNSRSPTPELAF